MTDEERLQELLEQNNQKLQGDINTIVSGAMARLVREELPKINRGLDERLTALESGLGGGGIEEIIQRTLVNTIDGLLEDDDQKEGQQVEHQESGTEVEDLRRAISEQSRKLTEFRSAQETLSQQLAAEREGRERAEKAARQKDMDNEVLSTIRGVGKVIPGTEQQLLALLKADGILKENKEEGRYLIHTLDETGYPTELTPEKGIERVVSEKYSHFLDRRPGTGTGASNTSSNSEGGQNRYLRKEGISRPGDLANAMSDPKERDRLLRELDGL